MFFVKYRGLRTDFSITPPYCFPTQICLLHLANICILQIDVSVCLTMGNVNLSVSLGQYLALCVRCSQRQSHLRQRALIFCRLNKFSSPVWASWSITGNSVLQPAIMRFKSTSIINLEFRCLCISKHCDIKNPKHNIWLSCIHHIFWVTFLNFFRKKNLKSLFN